MLRSYVTHLICSLAVTLSCSSWAHAQQPSTDDSTRAVARQLGVEGIDAYQANDLATAEQKLERAYRLFAAPTLGVFSARTRVKLGLWVEAAERYRQASRPAPDGESPAQKAAQREAAEELEALLPRIPTLTVVLAGAAASEVSVTFNGAAYASDLVGMARPTNPGSHRVVAVRGSQRIEQLVTLVEKDHKTSTLDFRVSATPPPVAASTPQPAAASPAQAAATLAEAPSAVPADTSAPASGNLWRPVGVAALSFGAVGLITWGVSSLVADGKLEKCPVGDGGDHWCDNDALARPYRTAKTISTVSFWTGAVLSLGGAGALLWDGRERAAAPSVSWGVGPTGATVRGVF
jgi:hypothetical protein